MIRNLASRTSKRYRKYAWANLANFFSKGYLSAVSEPKLVSHTKWLLYLAQEYNKEGMKVLELGSRVVTGSNLRHYFSKAEYVGFDFYKDANVDVVGDAHKLSSYFSSGDKFDLIFSSAVFEHLYMPWVVSWEIQKLLKIGGCVFIETTFSFSSHERPWNFFQFSDLGLRVLFNPNLGFEILDCGMCNPINGYYNSKADEYLRYKPVVELYAHSEILCRKTREVSDFDWAQCKIDDVVDVNSRYPHPSRIISVDDKRDMQESKRIWEKTEKEHSLSMLLMDYSIPFFSSIEEKKWVNRLAMMKFDREFYLDFNPDLRERGTDPILHFIHHGRQESRKYRFLLSRPGLKAY
jgi:hypothetical protein